MEKQTMKDGVLADVVRNIKPLEDLPEYLSSLRPKEINEHIDGIDSILLIISSVLDYRDNSKTIDFMSAFFDLNVRYEMTILKSILNKLRINLNDYRYICTHDDDRKNMALLMKIDKQIRQLIVAKNNMNLNSMDKQNRINNSDRFIFLN